jgi:wyosine [tRNA(Phe)-imidazoG37] synthetase (radical SAM superfamily)
MEKRHFPFCVNTNEVPLNNSEKKRRLIYGPVPSRRLGLSLGLDLVPFKTCSYNCIYCQLGTTKQTTTTRKSYVPIESILDQLASTLIGQERIDYVTLGGSGEPTLNDHIGELIHQIKELTDIPVAVLTNSSLFGNPIVRRSLLEAEVVLPSLDAYDNKVFQAINRPDPRITFKDMVEGLVAFRQEFAGAIWLEVFVLEGINATQEDAAEFGKWIKKINPEKIHVNTSIRPPAEMFAQQTSPDTLARFCRVLGNKAEIIAPFRRAVNHGTSARSPENLLNMLSRRPCTLEDLSAALAVHKNEILKWVDPLVEEGKVTITRKDSTIYYQVLPARNAS